MIHILFFLGYISQFSLIFDPILSIYNCFNIDNIAYAVEYDDLINNLYLLGRI